MRSLFLNSTRPFYAPENEGGGDASIENDISDVGSDGGGDAGGDVEGGDPSEGAGEEGSESGKPLSVREEIKKAMREAATPEQGQQQQPKPKGKKAAAPKTAPVEGQQQTPALQSAIAAPERLSKEAKAEWDKTPEPVKQAFIKAEQDMQRGVDELKGKYALIDKALAPHQDAIRQMNASPGEAVDRMFLWFKALSQSPVNAFPQLAKSFGMDWNKIVAATGQQAGGQQQPQTQQEKDQQTATVQQSPEYQQLATAFTNLQRELNEIKTGFGSMKQDVETQNYNKTRDNLNLWSQGKEYYEEVRNEMAQLLQMGVVGYNDKGQVDLDKAYETAIYMNPTVRAKVLAKQQQADQQVQQQSAAAATTAQAGQVAKAKKAAVSLPVGGAPGAGGTAISKQQAPRKGMSVRESLKASIAELRDQ